MHTCAIFDGIVARAAFSRAEKGRVNGLLSKNKNRGGGGGGIPVELVNFFDLKTVKKKMQAAYLLKQRHHSHKQIGSLHFLFHRLTDVSV